MGTNSITSYDQIHEDSREYLLSLERKFSSWVFMKDTICLRVALATYVANYLQGDPVWLLIVAPPSSGKTEILNLFRDLDDIYEIGTFTEASLLSGTPKREVAKDAKGGLLKEIGKFGILVCKDFTTVLSMNQDARSQALAALREIFDGRWARAYGTNGGWQDGWEGKIGFLGAVTQKIDTHHKVMSSMGERFIMFRMKTDLDTSLVQARKAIARNSEIDIYRVDLRNMTNTLMDHVLKSIYEPRVSDCIRERIAVLASLVACARTSIERNGYSRNIELIPYPEASPRLAQELMSLYKASLLIGCYDKEAWEIVRSVGFSSMPELRRRVLEAMYKHGEMYLKNVSSRVLHPETTVRRVLKELTGLKILEEFDEGGADKWRLTEIVSDLMDVLFLPLDYRDATFPEKSEDIPYTNAANTHLIFRESEVLVSGEELIKDTVST